MTRFLSRFFLRTEKNSLPLSVGFPPERRDSPADRHSFVAQRSGKVNLFGLGWKGIKKIFRADKERS
jgi:hypothetical protein